MPHQCARTSCLPMDRISEFQLWFGEDYDGNADSGT